MSEFRSTDEFRLTPEGLVKGKYTFYHHESNGGSITITNKLVIIDQNNSHERIFHTVLHIESTNITFKMPPKFTYLILGLLSLIVSLVITGVFVRALITNTLEFSQNFWILAGVVLVAIYATLAFYVAFREAKFTYRLTITMSTGTHTIDYAEGSEDLNQRLVPIQLAIAYAIATNDISLADAEFATKLKNQIEHQ
jgi:hypothetical protein